MKQVGYERKDGRDCPAPLRLPVHQILTPDTGVICLLCGTVQDQTSLPNTWPTNINPLSYNDCNTYKVKDPSL